jgi:V8-like Glu-specific endopeptidase
MNTKIWRSGAVLLAATTLAALTAPASAAPASERQAISKAISQTIGVAAQRDATAFWTPERMRAARPMPAPRVSARPAEVTDIAAGTPTVIEPLAFPSSGSAWTGGGSVVSTAGRVFFTYQGRTASCSGNAVTSLNKSTVITAGHCVKLNGAFHTNWVFVPAYDNGNAPFGTWSARLLQATPQWVASENISYDVGAAVVSDLNGSLLTDVVGAQGIAFNQPRGQAMYAFGYPAAAPYDGTRLIYCSGLVFNEFLGTGDIGMTCNMTGGASGGPWFLSFSEATGTGVLNSVNSFKYSFTNAWMFGPYFGADAQNLYNGAQTS